MSSWRSLVVDVAAVHRLARLVTADVLSEPLRARVIEAAYVSAGTAEAQQRQAWEHWDDVVARDGDPPKLATLVTCRWCASVWLALGVVVARRVAPSAWGPVAELLALSSASTLLSGLEDD